MVEETKAPAATPAPAPAASPAPTATPTSTAPRDPKPIARPGVITNPAPAVDASAPAQPKAPEGLPQSTIEEMAAGKKALERNQPVARALEDARTAKSAGTVTTPETNPVDATQTLHQQGKV